MTDKKKDFCSFWPDRNKEKDWSSCCEQHDICYTSGGNSKDRKKCDETFYECLKRKAPKTARLMYWGVRLFGGLPWHFKRDIFMRKRT